MQICTRRLHSNPILSYNLFSHSSAIVQQSSSNLVILTQEHDISGVYLEYQQMKVIPRLGHNIISNNVRDFLIKKKINKLFNNETLLWKGVFKLSDAPPWHC